jgi:hypothetical protein
MIHESTNSYGPQIEAEDAYNIHIIASFFKEHCAN